MLEISREQVKERGKQRYNIGNRPIRVCVSLYFRGFNSLSIQASIQIDSLFMQISQKRVQLATFLVKVLARLFFLLIYQISKISLFLYASQSDIILIISLFSIVVPSFTRQLYNNLELVQIITSMLERLKFCTTLFSVVLIVIALLKPPTILYSLLASTLYITLLHLVKF